MILYCFNWAVIFCRLFHLMLFYFLTSICYSKSCKFYEFYLKYYYARNLRIYIQMIVVIIVVKIVIMYLIVKTIIQIVVIVMIVAL